MPEAVSRFNSGRSPSARGAKRREGLRDDPVKRASCELGLRWLKMLADSEKTQLQWPGSYCDTQQSCCYPNNGKPASDFGIHGLWPNYNDGSYPSNCDSSDPFDESQVKDLIGNLQKNWPSLACPSSNGESFWSHEWVKHGTCSESVFDQHGYFQATLSFKKQVNLLQVLTNAGIEPNGNSYSLSSINKAIKEATGYTAGIECNTDESGNDQLYQIYLCVESSGTSLVECPVLPSGKCSSQVQFPSF